MGFSKVRKKAIQKGDVDKFCGVAHTLDAISLEIIVAINDVPLFILELYFYLACLNMIPVISYDNTNSTFIIHKSNKFLGTPPLSKENAIQIIIRMKIRFNQSNIDYSYSMIVSSCHLIL